MNIHCPYCNKPIENVDTSLDKVTCPSCSKIVDLEEDAPTIVQSPKERKASHRLGGYELLEMLGQGGMASVYKAKQLSLNRIVAVKILPPKLASSEEFVKRFNREAETLANLEHPNIVQVIDKGVEKGIYYFVMEYVDGKGLDQILKKKPLSLQEKIKILIEICKGLSYAHNKGVVHRDIKPANILIRSDGMVKISDFGIAAIIGDRKKGEELTMTGMGMGTLRYMAPEQKIDAKNVDQRADIYAFGVMLYEIITGQFPVGRFPLPSQINPEWDNRLDYIVDKCLQVKREERFQSIGEVQEILEDILFSLRESGRKGSTHLPITTSGGNSELITSMSKPSQTTVTSDKLAKSKEEGKKMGLGTFVVASLLVLFFLGVLDFYTLGIGKKYYLYLISRASSNNNGNGHTSGVHVASGTGNSQTMGNGKNHENGNLSGSGVGSGIGTGKGKGSGTGASKTGTGTGTGAGKGTGTDKETSTGTGTGTGSASEIPNPKEQEARYAKWIREGKDFFEGSQFQKAYQSYSKAYQIHPKKEILQEIQKCQDCISLKESLAKLFSKEGSDLVKGFERFQESLASYQNKWQDMPPNINEIFKQLSKLENKVHPFILQQGEKWERKREYIKAIEWYQKGINLSSEANQKIFQKKIKALKKKMAALQSSEKTKKEWNQKFQALMEKGKKREKEGKYVLALEWYQKALGMNPKDPIQRDYLKTKIALCQTKIQEAKKQEEKKRQFRIALQEGQKWEKKGNLVEALKWYQKAQILSEGNSKIGSKIKEIEEKIAQAKRM
ncbi:MAG: serine/threonine protein kinase, partial [Planctomycetota bacterium]